MEQTCKSLSPAQARVLAAIRSLTAEKGYPPSRREIADHCGLSGPSAVQYHVLALAEAGVIRHDPNSMRGLVIVEPEAAA